MKTPTTFELAQIAAALSVSGKGKSNQALATAALDLWFAAEKVGETLVAQERELSAGLFTLTQSEWNAIIAAYAGDKELIRERVLTRHVPTADALRAIFPAKNESAKTRAKKLKDLCKFAQKSGMVDAWKAHLDALEFTPDEIAWLLSAETWPGYVCRFLAHARQEQISAIRRESAEK